MSTSRVITFMFALGVGVLLAGTGCEIGREGDRCNPNLSHDECGDGLHCTQPVDCPENYCCPVIMTPDDKNPYCQPGCNGGQQSICAAGGDADCPTESSTGDDGASAQDASGTSDAPGDAGGG